MKKLLMTLLLAVASIAAFALPAPSEIGKVIDSGDYGKAESMLMEVLKEKPTAKVHYMLGQVYARQKRHADSINELKVAQALDPNLKFAAHPDVFYSTLAAEQNFVNNSNRVITVPTKQPTVYVARSKDDSNAFVWFFGIIGTIAALFALYGLITYILRKKKDQQEADDLKTRKEKDIQTQLATLLEMSSRLEDAAIICKSSNYKDTIKIDIGSRIKTLQTMVVGLITDSKNGEVISDNRMHDLKQNVDDIVEAASTGNYTPRTDVPVDYEVKDFDGRKFHSNQPYRRPSVDWKQPVASTPAQVVSPAPVASPTTSTVIVNQGSNNGFVEGLIIGDMMNNHHHTYDEPVRRHEPVDDWTMARPKPAPVEEVDTGSGDNWSSSDSSSSSSTDSGSSDNWSSSDSSSSSSSDSGSSGSDW